MQASEPKLSDPNLSSLRDNLPHLSGGTLTVGNMSSTPGSGKTHHHQLLFKEVWCLALHV